MASVKQLLDTTGATRIVNVWGAGAKSSVEELKAVVRALVDEYFVESELEEAVRCVVELDAPHFGHEVVKRIVYAALERGGHAMAAACALLKALSDRYACVCVCIHMYASICTCMHVYAPVYAPAVCCHRVLIQICPLAPPPPRAHTCPPLSLNAHTCIYTQVCDGDLADLQRHDSRGPRAA